MTSEQQESVKQASEAWDRVKKMDANDMAFNHAIALWASLYASILIEAATKGATP